MTSRSTKTPTDDKTATTSAELIQADAAISAQLVHSEAVDGTQLIFAPVNEAAADIGVIGLAVMGENLILNMASKGFTVAAFNRTTSKVDDFVTGRAKGQTILGADDLPTFVSLLKQPRKVMLMVKAGPAVDAFIEMLAPLLGRGRHHHRRRQHPLSRHGAAREGPGREGHPVCRRGRFRRRGRRTDRAEHHAGRQSGGLAGTEDPFFRTIAAQVNDQPCCDWVGDGGAGHFVKMVHNGIEYADMQMIS